MQMVVLINKFQLMIIMYMKNELAKDYYLVLSHSYQILIKL